MADLYYLDPLESAKSVSDENKSSASSAAQGGSLPYNQSTQNVDQKLASRVESLEKYVDDIRGNFARQGADANFNNLDVKNRLTANFGKVGGWDISSGVLSTPKMNIDSNNETIQSTNYQAGVRGFKISSDLVEAENIIARGTLKGTTFSYDNVSAVGGQLLVANADTLAIDMLPTDAAKLTVKGDTSFSVNDLLVVRGTATSGIQEEWMRVTAVAGNVYTITRDLAGSFTADNNPAWRAGTPVVKQGSSDGASTYSGGWLKLIGEGTNAPYYAVFQRTGVAYNAYTEVARFGNLNGFLSYASNLYGIAIGDADANLKYDTTNGFRLTGGMSLDWMSNVLFIGAYNDGFTNAGSYIVRNLLESHNILNGNQNTLMGPTLGDGYDWDDSYVFSFVGKVSESSRTRYACFGLTDTVFDELGVLTTRHVAFLFDDSRVSYSVADGTTQNKAVISGVTTTSSHAYRIYHKAGVAVYFYVDNVLKATVSTNQPSGTNNPPKITFCANGTSGQFPVVLTFNNNYTLSVK